MKRVLIILLIVPTFPRTSFSLELLIKPSLEQKKEIINKEPEKRGASENYSEKIKKNFENKFYSQMEKNIINKITNLEKEIYNLSGKFKVEKTRKANIEKEKKDIAGKIHILSYLPTSYFTSPSFRNEQSRKLAILRAKLKAK